MADVLVDLSMALICFAGQCHPALVGAATPQGVFPLRQYTTTLRGYGGDILVFQDGPDYVMAIHRVFRVAGQRRIERLQSGEVALRRNVTNGCINVTPEIYQKLVDCCSNGTLTIQK